MQVIGAVSEAQSGVLGQIEGFIPVWLRLCDLVNCPP